MTLTRESEQLLADMPLLGHGLSLLVPGTYALVRERLEQVEAAVRAEQAAEVERWKGHHAHEVEAKRKTAEHNRRLAAEKKAVAAEVERLRAEFDHFYDFVNNTDPALVDAYLFMLNNTPEAIAARRAATPVAPAPAATERCAACGHETRFHAEGQCDCEGDGKAGLCPCPEPRP